MGLDSEQEARIALLEHFTSQLQSYKTNILTLVVGFFAGVEALRIIEPPYWLLIVGICLGTGCLSGGLFYFIARAALFGRAASCCLRALPDLTGKAPDILLRRLGDGVLGLMKAEIANRKTRKAWSDRLVRLWDKVVELGYIENTLALFIVSLYLLCLWGSFVIGFVVAIFS